MCTIFKLLSPAALLQLWNVFARCCTTRKSSYLSSADSKIQVVSVQVHADQSLQEVSTSLENLGSYLCNFMEFHFQECKTVKKEN